MGLSFPKQVVRRRVRHSVTLKYLGPDGLAEPSRNERVGFGSRLEAETYAQDRVGQAVGAFVCYIALVSTEYTDAN